VAIPDCQVAYLARSDGLAFDQIGFDSLQHLRLLGVSLLGLGWMPGSEMIPDLKGRLTRSL
jgi:hypothetical protein